MHLTHRRHDQWRLCASTGSISFLEMGGRHSGAADNRCGSRRTHYSQLPRPCYITMPRTNTCSCRRMPPKQQRRLYTHEEQVLAWARYSGLFCVLLAFYAAVTRSFTYRQLRDILQDIAAFYDEDTSSSD